MFLCSWFDSAAVKSDDRSFQLRCICSAVLHLMLLLCVQLYRMERYSECRSVYTDLIRNSQDEYEEERKTNLSAVVAAMSQWEQTPMVTCRLCVLALGRCGDANPLVLLTGRSGSV